MFLSLLLSFVQVNLLILAPEKEYLRDTLFFAIFRDALLFDTWQQALSYQKYLVVEKRRTPPMLYTRKGEVLSNQALLDPRPLARCPEQLETVFGYSPCLSEECLALKEGREHIFSYDAV